MRTMTTSWLAGWIHRRGSNYAALRPVSRRETRALRLADTAFPFVVDDHPRRRVSCDFSLDSFLRGRWLRVDSPSWMSPQRSTEARRCQWGRVRRKNVDRAPIAA